MHMACRTGNPQIVKLLLNTNIFQQGDNIDNRTIGGETALMCAVRSGNAGVVVELLNIRANPFAYNALGETVLELSDQFPNNPHFGAMS